MNGQVGGRPDQFAFVQAAGMVCRPCERGAAVRDRSMTLQGSGGRHSNTFNLENKNNQ